MVENGRKWSKKSSPRLFGRKWIFARFTSFPYYFYSYLLWMFVWGVMLRVNNAVILLYNSYSIIIYESSYVMTLFWRIFVPCRRATSGVPWILWRRGAERGFGISKKIQWKSEFGAKRRPRIYAQYAPIRNDLQFTQKSSFYSILWLLLFQLWITNNGSLTPQRIRLWAIC